MRRAIRAVYV